MSFSSLGLSPFFLDVLEGENFNEPYPIQQQAIPAILDKKDVLGIAKTGSGKTVAFVLPILMNLQDTPPVKNRHIKVLVLVPTRELAIQVGEVFDLFSSASNLVVKSLVVHGGVSINPQMIAMHNVDILTATPGRLLELIESNAVHLSEISTMVIDEADKMLNLGFKEEMTRIFSLLPKKRQNLLFSATLSDDVKAINQFLLHDPIVIKIEEEKEGIDLINQTGYFVKEEKKGPLLRYLIRNNDGKQVLVFVSSVYKADLVAEKLKKNKINAVSIHSRLSAKARRDSLRNFKAGNFQVLVTTDLLSRGIDIELLPFVINYELPRSPKDYIHRIGRTGRAESSGDAISFVTPEDKHHFRVIQKKMGKWLTMIDSDLIELQGY
ncbi:MAG: DEAD/DEAH box helicase [Bacteroidales bacterium]|nr:DEAD/DEAH box helicase [Bacteroidales bacterium]